MRRLFVVVALLAVSCSTRLKVSPPDQDAPMSPPTNVEVIDDAPCVKMPWHSRPGDMLGELKDLWQGGRNMVELCVLVNGKVHKCNLFEVGCADSQ